MDGLEIAKSIVNALEEKKGEDIIILDIREQAIFTNYFVICTGSSDRMLNALIDSAEREVKTTHKIKPRVEGDGTEGWILADYGNVILHIFTPDRRRYYGLEILWSSGQIILHLQ